jgi:hypothetical protein
MTDRFENSHRFESYVLVIDEREFFHEEAFNRSSPAVLVDGLPARPSESWQEYTDRALKWLEIHRCSTQA